MRYDLKNNREPMDEIDRKLVEALTRDGRATLRDLASVTGLSPPATGDRLRRLEASGIITGYKAELDWRALGFTLEAMVRIKPLPGQLHAVERAIVDCAECIQCDKVTGEDCFIARLVLRSIDDLDPLLERFTERAETNTSIVKASPVPPRAPPLGQNGDPAR